MFHANRLRLAMPALLFIGVLFGCVSGDKNAAAATYTATCISGSSSCLKERVAAASPGDTIILADGTYNNAGTVTLQNYTGTTANPITIRANTPGGVVFTGKLNVYLKGSYLEFNGFKFDTVQHDAGSSDGSVVKLQNCSYCKVANNHFYRSGNAKNMGVPGAGSYGAYTHIVRIMGGTTHSSVEYNTFEQSISMSVGIAIGSSETGNTYNRIHHNYFKDIASVTSLWGNDTGGNGMEAVQIGQGDFANDTYTTVEYNLFENVIGDGAEIISVKSSNNIIRCNTFRNSPSMLTLRFGNNNTVDSNYFFNTKGGVRVYGENHVIRNNYIASVTGSGINIDGGNTDHYPSKNVSVVNNTIVYPQGNGIVLKGTSSYSTLPENNAIINNFVLNNKGTAVKDQGSTGTTYGSNMVQVSSPGVLGVTAPGITVTTGAAMSLSGELYRPSSTSTLINAGQTVTGLSVDMDGQTRTGNPDVGADEVLTGASSNPPLTSADVGKTW